MTDRAELLRLADTVDVARSDADPENCEHCDELRAAATILRKLAEPAPGLTDAEISAYSIPVSDKRFAPEIKIERAIQKQGAPLWAVRLDGDCLNKSGEWEWEPQPSSRTAAFMDRCRFATAEAAIIAAKDAEIARLREALNKYSEDEMLLQRALDGSATSLVRMQEMLRLSRDAIEELDYSNSTLAAKQKTHRALDAIAAIDAAMKGTT